MVAMRGVGTHRFANGPGASTAELESTRSSPSYLGKMSGAGRVRLARAAT